MKKIVIFAILACVMAASVFAQTFTVVSVNGRVQWNSAGRWTAVTVGMRDTLYADTEIRTPVGASVVLSDGRNEYTIPAGQTGKIEDLVAGLGQTGSTVATSDTTASSRTAGRVDTASARASVSVSAPPIDDEEYED